MVNSINANLITPSPTVSPALPASTSADRAAGGEGFANVLKRQLEQVSQMQTEADQSVQDLLTGRTDNITEVFTTARKAQLAFSLLMEIRNKLVDAYTELNQMRV